MSLITYPLNNIDYTAEDAELFLCTRKSGIWAKDSFMIFVNENKITIGKGIVWINNKEFSGKVAAMKSSETIDMGTAPSKPRIDVIALQFDANKNETTLIHKKGEENAYLPFMPKIQRDAALYEFYLCKIYRHPGATSITGRDVTDLRFDESLCGLMADPITHVDTSAIKAQISALIESVKSHSNASLADVEKELNSIKDLSGVMLRGDFDPNGNKVIPMSRGGIGATNPSDARHNLGIDVLHINSLSIPAKSFVDVECELPDDVTSSIPYVYISLVSTSESLDIANIEAVLTGRSGRTLTIRIFNNSENTRAPGVCVLAIE